MYPSILSWTASRNRSIDLGQLALDADLNAPVFKVPYKPMDTMALGEPLGAVTEADALDAA
jgi:hypothetical protein